MARALGFCLVGLLLWTSGAAGQSPQPAPAQASPLPHGIESLSPWSAEELQQLMQEYRAATGPSVGSESKSPSKKSCGGRYRCRLKLLRLWR
jgi:hypothetical protein